MKIDNIPIGTTILITIQVLVYLVNKFLYRGRLMKWGEGNSKAVFEDHEYWRLISAAFLHTKLYHIAANVIILVLLLDWLLEDYGCGCSFCYYILEEAVYNRALSKEDYRLPYKSVRLMLIYIISK